MKKRTTPKKPAAKKPGRPARFTQVLADQVLNGLMEGKSLIKVCKECGVACSVVYRWMGEHKQFREDYAHAREIGYMVIAEQILELSDGAPVVAMSEGSGNAEVQAIRVQIDSRKWLLGKMLPKQFGDRQAVEVTGADGGPLETVTTENNPHVSAAIKRLDEIRKRRREDTEDGRESI